MLLKRLVDYSVGASAVVLLSPLFVVIGTLIKLEDGGPIFFQQDRVGLRGLSFPCIKFRTMIFDAEKQMALWREQNSKEWQEYVAGNYKLQNDPRVTRIGKFLRRTSLDELPQIFNVLLGQMSLVGPRPLLAGEVGEYGPVRFQRYCEMLPGISGLWQVSGRSDTTFDMRAELDMQYWEKRNLFFDLAILAKTFQVVLGRDGAY